MMSTEFILSCVIAVATVAYTVINLLMLYESKRVRKLKITPHIVPYLSVSDNNSVILLFIKNAGEGLAKKVKVSIVDDYKMFGVDRYLLSEVGIFINGFEIFPAGYELKYEINRMRDSHKADQDYVMKLTFEYENINNEKFREDFDLPLNQVFGGATIKPPGDYLGLMAYHLDKIRFILDKINNKMRDN